MNFITKRFGAQKAQALSSNAIAAEIAGINGSIAKARARLPEIEAVLANLAVLSDEEHEAAESERASIKRGVARMQAQLAELQAALSEAQHSERIADLKGRADHLRRRIDSEAPKALDRYERAAHDVASALQAYSEIETAADVLNEELRQSGLPTIETPGYRFRRIPGTVTPERREKRKKWIRRVKVPVLDRNDKHVGWRTEEEDAGAIAFSLNGGKRVPDDLSCMEVDYEHVEPERREDDTWLPSLSTGVVLPPGRVGREYLWPLKG